ncbi:MAG: helix-hairpin-helix domain-containing protein [Patulibacter sp.]|nr:helix-hairpin-helix domain-containing protein [Patulibacter sp.]
MSYVFYCDWCGESIDSNEHVTFEMTRGGSDEEAAKRCGWAGHYHRGQCENAMIEALEAVQDASRGLRSVPAATQAEIDAERLTYRAPGDESPTIDEALPGVSSKGRGALKRAGIRTIAEAQLALVNAERLLRLPGIGQHTIAQLRDAVEALAGATETA